MHHNNYHDFGQHPQVLQVLKAADDAGQAVGGVELGEDMLEQGDQGSVHHAVEVLLLESLGRVLRGQMKMSKSSA